MATDAPDNAQAIAKWLNTFIYRLKSGPALAAALEDFTSADLIPWVNSTEGQEARSIAVGFLGKFFGGLAGGPVANGLEQATDADILALVAIVVKPPESPA